MYFSYWAIQAGLLTPLTFGQYPLLAPSVHYPYMVWGCVHVCAVHSTGIVQNELKCGYANVVHTSSSFRPHTRTHTHSHTIWGQQTNGAKSGHCRLLPGIAYVPWLLLFPVRTFFTMEGSDSEFMNFTLPTLKAFFEAHHHNVSGYKQ